MEKQNEIEIVIQSCDDDERVVQRIKKLYEQLANLNGCFVRIVVKV